MPDVLKSYASGSGAISLVWQDGDNAIGRRITLDDAHRFLFARENRHLFAKGYRPMVINTQPCLVKMYERVSENQVRPVMDEEDKNTKAVPGEDGVSSRIGDVYTYKLHDYDHGSEYRISSFELVTFKVDDEDMEIKNWNILGSMAFFLTHEKAITEQLPEAKALTLPPDYDPSRVEKVARILHREGEIGVKHLLLSVMHYCYAEKLDFDKLTRNARQEFDTI